MKKFLQVLKVLFYTSLVLGVIALVVCYITIPQETKLAIDVVVEYINTPLPIIGVSILVVGVFAYKIISTTSIGKKGLGTLKSDFSKVQNTMKEYDALIKEKIAELEKKEKEIKGILDGYSTEIDTLTDKLAKVCETSPNVKIKALGYEIKGEIKEIKQETIEKLESAKNEYAEVVYDKVDLNEIKDNYQTLLDELKALKEKVEYGKAEETENSSADQE